VHNLHFAIYICILPRCSRPLAWLDTGSIIVQFTLRIYYLIFCHFIILANSVFRLKNSTIVNIFPCHSLLYFHLAIIQPFASISIINWTNCTFLSVRCSWTVDNVLWYLDFICATTNDNMLKPLAVIIGIFYLGESLECPIFASRTARVINYDR